MSNERLSFFFSDHQICSRTMFGHNEKQDGGTLCASKESPSKGRPWLYKSGVLKKNGSRYYFSISSFQVPKTFSSHLLKFRKKQKKSNVERVQRRCYYISLTITVEICRGCLGSDYHRERDYEGPRRRITGFLPH